MLLNKKYEGEITKEEQTTLKQAKDILSQLDNFIFENDCCEVADKEDGHYDIFYKEDMKSALKVLDVLIYNNKFCMKG